MYKLDDSINHENHNYCFSQTFSRFDTMITFGLPDHQNRQEIAAKYAKHLKKSELDELATITEG